MEKKLSVIKTQREEQRESFEIMIADSVKRKEWEKLKMPDWPTFIGALMLRAQNMIWPMTHEEYIKAHNSENKDEKDEAFRIKNMAGLFAEGIYEGNNRNKNSIKKRRLITLDAEDMGISGEEFIKKVDNYLKVAGNLERQAFLYSTVSNTPDNPRYRLIINTNRDMTPIEYQAVARRIAEAIGLEYFDPSTFQPERAMYWPQNLVGSKLYMKEWGRNNEEPMTVDVDTILGTYEDFRDEKEWPDLKKREKKTETALKNYNRQNRNLDTSDPREKTGWVGAFCLTYNVREAIEKYLPDTYEEMEDGRFRYVGSTSNAPGFIIYYDFGGTLCYSHHSSDPIHGDYAVNSFDLVRIHKFGNLDAKAKDNTPVNRLPSYLAMVDLIKRDEDVRRNLKVTRANKKSEEWTTKLIIDKNGKPSILTRNFMLIIANDCELRGKFIEDTFMGGLMVKDEGIFKIEGKKKLEFMGFRPITDNDYTRVVDYISGEYLIQNKQITVDCLNLVAEKNATNMAYDYLKETEWDGVKRMETVFIDFLGVEDTPLNRTMTRKWLCAAIVRLRDPGTQFDSMLMLIGDQGLGKTTILRKLGLNRFYVDLKKVDAGDAKSISEVTKGSFIAEFGEGVGYDRASIEAVKSTVTNTQMTYRPAYAREKITRYVHYVFAYTSNNTEVLNDATGARRNWPMQTDASRRKYIVGGLDENNVWTGDMTLEYVKQIWAEVIHHLDSVGEKLYLNTDEEKELIIAQEPFINETPIYSKVEKYLCTFLDEDLNEMTEEEIADKDNREDDLKVRWRENISIQEIWVNALNRDFNSLNRAAISMVKATLLQLGYTQTGKRKYTEFGRVRTYSPRLKN